MSTILVTGATEHVALLIAEISGQRLERLDRG